MYSSWRERLIFQLARWKMIKRNKWPLYSHRVYNLCDFKLKWRTSVDDGRSLGMNLHIPTKIGHSTCGIQDDAVSTFSSGARLHCVTPHRGWNRQARLWYTQWICIQKSDFFFVWLGGPPTLSLATSPLCALISKTDCSRCVFQQTSGGILHSNKGDIVATALRTSYY